MHGKERTKNMAKNSFYTRDKQEVKEITDQLEEGLKELFAKEKYKSYLSMMSKMHNYSANNIQLITMQLQGKTQGATLKEVYRKFNIDHPADYKGHSLSVSDIVVLHEGGENSAHFVDSVGFTGLPDFMRKLEGVKEQETTKEETKTYPPLYHQPITYAVEHNQLHFLSCLCRERSLKCQKENEKYQYRFI